jgi:hypothetical protein
MRLTAAQIGSFANDWRVFCSRHSLAHRLTEFSLEARPLLLRTRPVLKRGPSVSADRLERAIIDFRPLVAARTKRGEGINIWSAAGVGTDERRNVGVLAQLWMRASMGQVSAHFLKVFLSRVAGADGVNLDQGYSVHTEHRPMGDGAHRIDLVIETRQLIIGIEAKIRAPADADQLARYAGELKARAAHKGLLCRHELIFLGPRLRSFDCALSSTWDDVASAARDVARNSTGNSRRLLRDFANHISRF